MPVLLASFHDENYREDYDVRVEHARKIEQVVSRRRVDKWAATQRRMYRTGKLSKRCQAKLEAIEGWQWASNREVHTREKAVQIAEARARENGGKIESREWLIRNGFDWLVLAMRRFPLIFAHIRQEPPSLKRRRTDWVPIAEERARANEDGMLESVPHLVAHGFTGLVAAMNKSPELFAHIPQRRFRKRCRTDWVPVAEDQARCTGEILKAAGILRARGFVALTRAMDRSPALYTHIPQEVRASGGVLIAVRGGGPKGAAIARRLGVRHEE